MSDETRRNMTKLDTLTPSQRVFVMYRARGRSVAESAKEAGVARNTPASTWNMDLINAAILEIQQQMITSPIEAIGPLIPKAVAKLNAALDRGEEWAITETFDRGWGKPVQTNKNENTTIAEYKVYVATPDFDPDNV